MHLQVCGGEDKKGYTRTRSFASPGGVGRGEAMSVGTRRVRE
jgi:hypothetical protein